VPHKDPEVRREYQRLYKAANYDRIMEHRRLRYEENRQLLNQKQLDYYHRNKEQINSDANYSRRKARHAELRRMAIERMGGHCVSCGLTDYRALQFDHIDGGGAEYKQRGRNLRLLYRKIADGTVANGLQLLCASCHAIKTYTCGDHLPRTKRPSSQSEGPVASTEDFPHTWPKMNLDLVRLPRGWN
jgi:hypothetical protein